MAAVDWVSLVQTFLNNAPDDMDPPAEQGSQGAVIAGIAGGIQGTLEATMGRTFDVRTYTEARSGRDRPDITLQWDPIVSVSQVLVWGAPWTVVNPAVTPVPTFTSICINEDGNGIEVLGGVFPRGQRNVIVTYRAGLTPDHPLYAPAVEAGVIWIAQVYRSKNHLALSSIVTQGGQTTFRERAPDVVKQMLGPCIRVAREC